MKRWLCLIAVLLLITGAAVCMLLPASENTAVTSTAELELMLLDDDDGVSVLAVRDHSPAERAGIMPGDILTTANGTAFQTIEQLEQLLHAAVERSLLLQLRRSPQDEILLVQLFLH